MEEKEVMTHNLFKQTGARNNNVLCVPKQTDKPLFKFGTNKNGKADFIPSTTLFRISWINIWITELTTNLVILIKPCARQFVFRTHANAFLKIMDLVIKFVERFFGAVVDAVLIQVDRDQFRRRV